MTRVWLLPSPSSKLDSSDTSAALGVFSSGPSPSQTAVCLFWAERSLRSGGVLWSPGLKDWESPEPPLASPIPQPWRDPSFLRPPEPGRVAGIPGTEMSGSPFLPGTGDPGALLGSERRINSGNCWFHITVVQTTVPLITRASMLFQTETEKIINLLMAYIYKTNQY